MKTRIPLASGSQDLNSRKSRAEMINCYFRANDDGNYRDLTRAQSLVPRLTVGEGPIRGMFAIRDQFYVVSGPELYLIEQTEEGEIPELLGNVGGTDSPVRLNANGSDNNQLIVVSDQRGFIYDQNGFAEITDEDFTPDFSVASLDQRFWLNAPNSSKFFGSDVANGFSYNALTFASAEQSPDELRYVAATKTNLWLFGGETVEYWQTVQASFPLRRVTGATIEKGLLAKASLVQYEDKIFFLASDLTIRMLYGNQMTKISDLAVEQAVKGDGTPNQPGYGNVEDAEAFFIDHPSRKFYVITFPSVDVTWVYDLSTNLWHKRSTDGGRWLARTSQAIFNTILVGSSVDGTLYDFSEGVDGLLDPVEITTPITTADKDLYISEIELICEVGYGTISNEFAILDITKTLPIEPLIQMEYSKDGGRTWKAKRDVSIGRIGEWETRVKSRLFGRTKYNFEFLVRFRLTDPVYFKAYELWADIL